jgi:predicted alpha-1,2-mannosidase
MLSRRHLLASAAAAGVAAALPRKGRAQPIIASGFTALVDPMIGTGGHGHVYPGATVPYGMVQLSPDTDNARWDACSGYYHDDTTVMGFSHTHLSGTGGIDMMDLLVVPGVGEVILNPGTRLAPENSYRKPMHHDQETATPGYYRLGLPESGITAELTATARAGLHRYTFPAGATSYLLIDWHHGGQINPATPTPVTEAMLRIIGNDTLVGTRRVQLWAPGRVIHFAMKFSQPFVNTTFYDNDQPLLDGTTSVSGAVLKCVVNFNQTLNAPLLVKVGISSVDIDGALNNLKEVPDFDFERVRAAAAAAWEAELSHIRIDTPNDTDRKIFYAGLYHAKLAPTLFCDLDGRYRGMDTAVHQLPPGRNNYSTYSLWDTYRALHPMLSIIDPVRAADFAANLIDMGAQSPSGPCIWPLQGIETFCMIGWHSSSVIAEALAKGLPGVDAQKAWALYRKLAFDRFSPGLAAYRTNGYIAADSEGESVSKTLEYCYDDWAMARLAQAAGDNDSAAKLRDRSRNYKNVFDPQTQFTRPKLKDGTWALPFVPNAMGHNSLKWWDFTESNAWQATFFNQHDVYTYIAMFGGDKAFEAKLDALFTAPSDLPPDAPPDMTGLIGQYVHGNEPSHHVAYLYAFCGAHYKTQARVQMLLKTQYRAGLDGLSGNEDCGQMSAWYILSALGFYPVDPVSTIYVFGSPIFPRADVSLPGGKTFTVIAEGVDDTHMYIRNVTWNGRRYTKTWLSYADIMAGGVLKFTMSDKPNPDYGASPADRPPSFHIA